MAGKPYPVQQYAHPPVPVNNMNYNQAPYNPGPYPPQPSAAYPPQPTAGYPPQSHPGGAYPPAAALPAGPPPPYYQSDPYPHQSAAYPPVQAGYPQQPAAYPQQVAAYPPGVQITGSYDSSARFGAGATHTIPPPPPGVLPNAAQVANMRGQSVQMNQKPAGWFEGHTSGGTTFW